MVERATVDVRRERKVVLRRQSDLGVQWTELVPGTVFSHSRLTPPKLRALTAVVYRADAGWRYTVGQEDPLGWSGLGPISCEGEERVTHGWASTFSDAIVRAAAALDSEEELRAARAG